VIVVFGAGGDRDRGKRPLMGAAASRYADFVLVTSDNPRSEDPHRIIEEVVAGANSNAELEVEVDRARAIEEALRVAQPGDVVVIAGKGHERVQEMAGRVVAFDDAEVARQALLRLQAAGGGW
jgi:UDP-N-acetylmuramoyl-L-alanyl-D-glutamate--2,6-diaminopimelate ligase